MNPGNLLRQAGYHAHVVVHACEAQHDRRNRPTFFRNHRLCRSLRARIGPARLDRLPFVDAFTGPARLVHEHRARIHELFDLKVVQGAQQVSRPLDVDGLIQRMVYIVEVEVRRKVDHTGEPVAELGANAMKCQRDRICRPEISLYGRKSRASRFAIQSYHAVAGRQGRSQRPPDVAADAGDQDQRRIAELDHVKWPGSGCCLPEGSSARAAVRPPTPRIRLRQDKRPRQRQLPTTSESCAASPRHLLPP